VRRGDWPCVAVGSVNLASLLNCSAGVSGGGVSLLLSRRNMMSKGKPNQSWIEVEIEANLREKSENTWDEGEEMSRAVVVPG
jgi:hypothetical protein